MKIAGKITAGLPISVGDIIINGIFGSNVGATQNRK